MKNWYQVYVQIFSQAVIIIFLNIVVIPLDCQFRWVESTAYLIKKSARNDGISGLGIRLEKSEIEKLAADLTINKTRESKSISIHFYIQIQYGCFMMKSIPILTEHSKFQFNIHSA